MGDRIIHIQHFKGHDLWVLQLLERHNHLLGRKGVFRHSICKAAVGEMEAFKRYQAGQEVVPSDDIVDYYIETCASRHESCKTWRSSSGGRNEYWTAAESAKEAEPMDLSLLRICRTVYEVANVILWTTNTFSFSDGESFGEFVAKLNPPQKQKLARLHLGTTWADGSRSAKRPYTICGRHLKVAHIQTLRGLKTLNLCFNIITRIKLSTLHGVDPLALKVRAKWYEPVMRFRCLDLRNVTVVVTDDVRRIRRHLVPNSLFDEQSERLTADRKRAIAQHIMSRLTNPQGAAEFAAEEAVSHAANKAKRDMWFLP